MDLHYKLISGNKFHALVVLFCLSGSSAVTELRIGEWENLGFEGDTDGVEDTDWYALGGIRTSVPWPFLNRAPGHIITPNVPCSKRCVVAHAAICNSLAAV